MKTQNPEAKGIKSVETGCEILEKIASFDQPLSVTEISRICSMSPSKVHHYIVSLCRAGFLDRGADGRYGISLKLSLLGLNETNQSTIKKLIEPYIKEFCMILNETVAFSIWGDNGPIVLLQEKSSKSINLSVEQGSTMRLTTSANGRLFAVFYDRQDTYKLLEKEIKEGGMNEIELYNELNQIREQGYSITEGGYSPGFSCIAVPVFNRGDKMIGALSAIGLCGIFDVSPQSAITLTTLKKGQELSRVFGKE